MGNAGDDDPRSVELETLEAIFPEIRHPQDSSAFRTETERKFTFELELPVEPAKPVNVVFPAASTASNAAHDGTAAGLPTAAMTQDDTQADPVDTLLVSHLPPLSLRITLPDGYPSDKAPVVTLSTAPQWLAAATLHSLEDDGPRLWEESGRDMVAYTYIDHLQREAENVFGTISPGGTLEVSQEHKLAVLDFDINAKKAAFEKETFDCGICLDPKKGTKCHKMMDCGHIFCLQCLQDFYDDVIKEGNLSSVRCLTPNCAKERASNSAAKSKTFISPSELLQIGLSEDMVKRYVNLKYKTELEADKDTIYCPRQWCNGAARSKKHKKPEGLDFMETFNDQVDAQDENLDVTMDEKATGRKKVNKKFNPADLLSICEECGFAFCSRCLQTWHGEFVRCTPKRNKDELTEEEKASMEYLQFHTSPCPTCNAPAQKTHGCNHMICSRCDTHFCYLCSSWLDPANPYKHYNQQADGKVTSCYMRLWELEGGDGDDVGLGFVGGRGPGAGPVPNQEDLVHVVPEIEEPDTDEDEDAREAPRQPLDNNGNPIAVAREAPLVLRVMDNQHRRDPAPQPPPLPGRGRGRGQHRGAHRGDARGRGGYHGPPVRGHNRPRAQQQPAQRGARHIGRGAAAVQRQQQQQQGQEDIGEGELDPAQEAWVRRFVQMALIDAEDEVDGGDSDSDDGNWRIR